MTDDSPIQRLSDHLLARILHLASALGRFQHALVFKKWCDAACRAQDAVQLRADRRMDARRLLSELSAFPKLTELILSDRSLTPIPEGFLSALGAKHPELIKFHFRTMFDTAARIECFTELTLTRLSSLKSLPRSLLELPRLRDVVVDKCSKSEETISSVSWLATSAVAAEAVVAAAIRSGVQCPYLISYSLLPCSACYIPSMPHSSPHLFTLHVPVAFFLFFHVPSFPYVPVIPSPYVLMGRPEYVSDEEERDGDAVTALGECREEDEERRPQEEGAEEEGAEEEGAEEEGAEEEGAEEEGAEEEGAERGGTAEEGGSGDEESNDELGHERAAAIEFGAVKGEMAGEDDNEDDDSDSDDAPEEFTLSQGRERVSQQRQQEAEARRMVAEADRKVRQKRAGLAAKGEEGEGGEEGDGEERRSKDAGGKAKRRRELEGRADRRTRRKGAAEGGDEAAGSLVPAEARDGAREEGTEGGAGAGEGEGGALGEGAVEGGDLLPADVIAAVTRRQHTRFTEAQEERERAAVREKKQRAGRGGSRGKESHTSAVIGTRWVLWSDGAIVIQAGAPAPEGEEAARAIMRAAQSFRHGVLFGRRQRSVAALGFVDPRALKVAGQWRAHKHLVAGGAGGAGAQGGVGVRRGGAKKKGRRSGW
ncbi:unnamed protein product [Closterium sp. Naga37s-1]|nr:unnamed protein product [Closterium sp. Naga37s-1]